LAVLGKGGVGGGGGGGGGGSGVVVVVVVVVGRAWWWWWRGWRGSVGRRAARAYGRAALTLRRGCEGDRNLHTCVEGERIMARGEGMILRGRQELTAALLRGRCAFHTLAAARAATAGIVRRLLAEQVRENVSGGESTG
jgi:hypothetical protein